MKASKIRLSRFFLKKKYKKVCTIYLRCYIFVTEIKTKNNLILIIMNSLLQKRILKQIGVSLKEFKANVTDYQNASGGIPGFVYYSETHKFALKNQDLIIELLEEQADSLGEDVFSMISNFGIFRNGMDKEEKKDIYKFLGGNKNEKSYETYNVLNIMAWVCVEHLAFELDN